ncbi:MULTISPECIES: glycoside hydrolase family 88 protein [Olivibacter]|uniref:Glycoside hydrolase family 88 protein n=1 Tax=Olivibacter jilunii TaxID=985016 RepID=A0ABW6B214_9SPHI|nr:glycoside hydrolase family 88 protein [Olivibacter sp. 47]MCL4639132.1 glycoside hydrolase family 88 protein [Olivibacter sp. UJ_SKK_5.1]MDM8178011.1 glycoside hydrolase family 88 protein [Olivibacter sp. 47]MDX3916469.1 glycoside hydrolase family 88 protein [Pseudosphingobacterium sp.]
MIRKLIKRNLLQLLLFLLAIGGCSTGKQVATKGNKSLTETIEQRFKHASTQYKLLMEELQEDKLPKTYVKANNFLETSGSDWWTSGFYPGTLWALFEETNDSVLLKEARRTLKLLAKQQTNDKLADLGAIMYNSFGTAMKIDPQVSYQKTLVASAKTLMKRYNAKVKAIRSWDTRQNDKEFVVVIDHLMNLELLFWATHATGDSAYYKVACNEAETIWKNHIRPDYSTCQIVTFDTKTGKVKHKRNAQGYNDESCWARGQAWALYGFTVLYRETSNPTYLNYAEHIAEYILNEPNLPKDKVPYWDFNAPDIPNTYRDASAAAIMSAAFLELSGYSTNNGKTYFKAGEAMLETLASPEYTALLGANGGFILMHGAGYIPVMAEVDVPLPYADYYYIQALKRYKMLTMNSSNLNASFRYP